MPCSDCLTPTLHVRTTERPPRFLLWHSAHDQPLSSFSLSHFSRRSRDAPERCTLRQGLSGSPTSPSPILRPRPNQPFLSEIFRRPRACTSLHLTPPPSFPRSRKRAGQSRAHVRHFHSCHSSRIRPGGWGNAREAWEISLSYSRASEFYIGENDVTLFFSLQPLDFNVTVRIEKEISIE